MAAYRSEFLSTSNIEFMLVDSVVLGLVALGEMFVLLVRGIDLSVAPIVGLSALVTGMLANSGGLSLVEAIFLAIALGAVLGCGNALLVGLLRLPPIIATLGTLFVYSGLMFVYTNGKEVNSVPSSYVRFANSEVVSGVPAQALLLVVIAAAVWAILSHTVRGRQLYAVGNHPEAARHAGITVLPIVASAYIICGALSGFAGLVLVSYSSYANSTTGTGTNIELAAIAAALVGGTALSGGRGGPFGTILGAFFLTVILTSVVFLHVPAVWEPAGEGALILLAVGIDQRLNRERVPQS
ncbi:MAG TPA: ABC transporter permease [Solirubrobacteraceae bacterium]|jgi:ribose/xylose/arabinose/galactoside ABC-type transport system permease subunit|nr:ABC transporter permease [Solirubrobacteraceae bacterium]